MQPTRHRLKSTSDIRKQNKAIVDIRLRPRSGAAPWWVSLRICHGVISMLLPIESLLRRLFLASVCKHHVIHKTGEAVALCFRSVLASVRVGSGILRPPCHRIFRW